MINLAKLHQSHAQFDLAFTGMVDSATRSASEYGAKNAKERLSPHTRSGRLVRSTSGRVIKVSNNLSLVRLENYAMARSGGIGYASFIDKGTNPHLITAKNRKALRFYFQGRLVFVRSVYHPGTPAYGHFTKARMSSYLYAGNILRTEMRRIATRF